MLIRYNKLNLNNFDGDHLRTFNLLKKLHATSSGDDGDVCGLCVERVLQHFLEGVRRPLDHLAGRDSVDHDFVQTVDHSGFERHHWSLKGSSQMNKVLFSCVFCNFVPILQVFYYFYTILWIWNNYKKSFKNFFNKLYHRHLLWNFWLRQNKIEKY